MSFGGAFSPAADFASTWWQYVLLFLAVAASWAGVPMIGSAAAGAAAVGASQGHLNLASVIIVTAIAGEVGGLLGYDIGLRWGRELVQRPGKHLSSREKVLAKGERAYEKWGRLAVFFTPALVSGTAKMPHREFVVWNLLDALGFAFFVAAGAYGIGRLVTGHNGIRDIAILVVGVGVGSVILVLVRRHHRRWVTNHESSHRHDETHPTP
jgi:membrane protein DedA with SNARE-associated domain